MMSGSSVLFSAVLSSDVLFSDTLVFCSSGFCSGFVLFCVFCAAKIPNRINARMIVPDRLREEAGEILVERNVREVVFDFRKTVFMDSSGIGLVMGRFREMELIGGKVRAVHVGERMRRILVMSGVTRVIEVEEEKTWK